jgi:hypothetical protein
MKLRLGWLRRVFDRNKDLNKDSETNGCNGIACSGNSPVKVGRRENLGQSLGYSGPTELLYIRPDLVLSTYNS